MYIKVEYENDPNSFEYKKDKHLEVEIGRYQGLNVDQNRTKVFGSLNFISDHLFGTNDRKDRVVMLDTFHDTVSFSFCVFLKVIYR